MPVVGTSHLPPPLLSFCIGSHACTCQTSQKHGFNIVATSLQSLKPTPFIYADMIKKPYYPTSSPRY